MHIQYNTFGQRLGNHKPENAFLQGKFLVYLRRWSKDLNFPELISECIDMNGQASKRRNSIIVVIGILSKAASCTFI